MAKQNFPNSRIFTVTLHELSDGTLVSLKKVVHQDPPFNLHWWNLNEGARSALMGDHQRVFLDTCTFAIYRATADDVSKEILRRALTAEPALARGENKRAGGNNV